MKATIEIEFKIDGENPGHDAIEEAVFVAIGSCGYVGSESVDGTDNWGLEIGTRKVAIYDDASTTPLTDACWEAHQSDPACDAGDPWGLSASLERRLNECVSGGPAGVNDNKGGAEGPFAARNDQTYGD